jgi:hypothetical protein
MAAHRIAVSGIPMTGGTVVRLQSIVAHGIKAGASMQQSNGVFDINGPWNSGIAKQTSPHLIEG